MQFQGSKDSPLILRFKALNPLTREVVRNPITLKHVFFNLVLGIQYLKSHLYLCFAAMQFPSKISGITFLVQCNAAITYNTFNLILFTVGCKIKFTANSVAADFL